MRTKWSYNPISSDQARVGPFQKLFAVAMILALLASFLAVPNVFAAPASDDDPWEHANLDLEWKNKLENLRFENVFYAQVKVFPADYKDPDERARVYELLGKFGSALKAANEVANAHVGFDDKGNVLNEERAYESIQDLAIQLHTMRGIREKLEEEGLKTHKIK